jgi:hypothetical protein
VRGDVIRVSFGSSMKAVKDGPPALDILRRWLISEVRDGAVWFDGVIVRFVNGARKRWATRQSP